MSDDYREIRRDIQNVVPGFEDFEERVAVPGGFVLPRGPHDSRTFNTATGKARFTVNPPNAIEPPPGHLLLQTLRSHDQFNTTIYGLDDRYRGIFGGRNVVFLNHEDWSSAACTMATSSISSVCGPTASDERSTFASSSTKQRRLGRRRLPRGQRPRATRRNGDRQQHTDLKVDRRASGAELLRLRSLTPFASDGSTREGSLQ